MTGRAHAQAAPFAVTIDGPEAAAPGDAVTYHLHYSRAAGLVGASVQIPCHAVLLSERIMTGYAPIEKGVRANAVYWFGLTTNDDGDGEIEINMRIDKDFNGTVKVAAYIVDGGPGRSSNAVETRVGDGRGELDDGSACASIAPTPTISPESTCGRARDPGEVAIMGTTIPPVDGATIRIPELNLTYTTVRGCYEFRHLVPPHDPMLVSFEVRADGYRPLTWLNYTVLRSSGGFNFTPPLYPGSEPILVDFCAGLLEDMATPQRLSAAQQGQATLCAQLPHAGTGMPSAHPWRKGVMLLVVAGLAFLGLGLAIRRSLRASS